MLLAETNEGYHNLIKLVSAGYTEGFYYKPRIDKELLAQHSKGLIGLSSCLKGEVAEGLSHQQEQQGDRGGGRVPRHPRRRTTSSSRCSGTASRSSASSTAGCRRSRSDLGLPLVCTNDVHYLREADAHPHDILLCIGTGKAFSDPKRLRYDAKQFFLKTAEEMAEVVQGLPGRARQHGAHRRALQRQARRAARTTCPNFDVPAGFTLDELLRARRARRVRASGCRGCSSSPPTGTLRHTIDEYERRLAYELDDDQADEVSRATS